jgi:hypothetical protein
VARSKAIRVWLRILTQGDDGKLVPGSLMVDFEGDKKVNHKILGYPRSHLLCLKNRQIGPSAIKIGLGASSKRIIHRLIHRKCGAPLADIRR